MKEISTIQRISFSAAISMYQQYPVSLNIYTKNGSGWVIGVTGIAGVGKSTLLAPLIECFRNKDLTVACLAIDPSSDITGGATLGDRKRIRGRKIDEDKGVFFRSLATHSEVSALTNALPEIIRHARCVADVILVETAGAGQTDVEIRHHTDTLIEVLAPLGDFLTLSKAGQNEHTDIFVVNDRESYTNARKFFAAASIKLNGRKNPSGWEQKIFLADAKKRTGISEVMVGVFAHKKFLTAKLDT